MSARRTGGDEQGSILVLTALLMPVLVALGALALGGTTLRTTHEDAQRSVDLGALAGAAAIPSISVTPGAATLPVPIDGLDVTRGLADAFDASDWRDRPCDLLTRQLAGDRSAVLNASVGVGDARGCTALWEHESPTLAALAACAGELLDIANCAGPLRSEIARTRPAVDATQAKVTRAMTKASDVADHLTNPADKILTAANAALLSNGCVVQVTVTIGFLTTTVCTVRLLDRLLAAGGTTLDGLDISPTGAPQLGVDLDGLLPAVLTPRLTVQLHGAKVHPTLSPFTFDLSGSATARRTIKSALVLPSLGIPGTTTQTAVDARIGASSTQVLAQAGTSGYVVDPNDLTRYVADSNALGRTFDLLDAVDDAVGGPVVDALTEVACRRAPVSRHCPQIDGVIGAETLRSTFLQDLQDATQPPPSGSQPTVQEELERLSQSGDPTWVVGGLRRIRLHDALRDVLTGSELTLLENPLLNPSIAPLLSGFVFVPALDVVPVIVSKTVVDDNRPIYTLRRLPLTDALATTGLYQARLVK